MPSQPARLRALQRALTFVGTTEQPPRSNRGKEIDKWNRQGGAPKGSYWCASFAGSMFADAGVNMPPGYASVATILAWARPRRYMVARPLKGDLVCFEFGTDVGFDDHIGIVKRVLAVRWAAGKFTGWIQTVEGNTSAQADIAGSQSNGGGVFIRRRWVRGTTATFVRIP